jgi:hypothetical protein
LKTSEKILLYFKQIYRRWKRARANKVRHANPSDRLIRPIEVHEEHKEKTLREIKAAKSKILTRPLADFSASQAAEGLRDQADKDEENLRFYQ